MEPFTIFAMIVSHPIITAILVAMILVLTFSVIKEFIILTYPLVVEMVKSTWHIIALPYNMNAEKKLIARNSVRKAEQEERTRKYIAKINWDDPINKT